MAQEKVMHLIDHARDLHAQLSMYYEELGERTEQERVKILLKYLSESEARHEEALEEYERVFASPDVTDTWFQFEPDMMTTDEPFSSTITPDMDIDEVLREVLRFDEQLSELYREIIKRAQFKRIKEVFSNLLQTNEKEMRDLARDFAHMHDW